jgi:hypothetical protein
MQFKLISKKDIAFIFLVFIYVNQKSSNVIATITKDREVIYQINLSKVEEPYEIEIPGECPAVILVENNAISFEKASCKDQICVHTGKISAPLQSAICLPAKISISISGKTSLDAVTG